jgi:1-deoxy-D-xylulose-5-phosphate reductoisomerase
MEFTAPDLERFPCIELAYQALRRGGTQPAVLNVANEQAVYRFLAGEIPFTHIPLIIEAAGETHSWIAKPSLDDMRRLEQWTTQFVKAYKIG